MDDNIPLTSAAPPVVRIIYKITAYINENTVIHCTGSCYIHRSCGLSLIFITFSFYFLRDQCTGGGGGGDTFTMILLLIEVDRIIIYIFCYL